MSEQGWVTTTPAPPSGQTIVRTYKGKPDDAAAQFQRDAAVLAEQGYRPVNQVYTPGTWSCAAFLVALLLCIILIGIVVFIYMLIVKPAGTLTVTYEKIPVPVT